MKAVQTRSPIHLAYEYANLNNVIVSIWVSDSPNIDSTTTPDYQLNSQAINDFATVEISELIRSKNDYIFNSDFYEKRDTAKYVLIRAVLLDDNQLQLEVKYDFLRARDGYLRRADGVSQKELPQVYKNIIPTNISTWDAKLNAAITPNQADPFKENNAYLAEDVTESNNFILLQEIPQTGDYTLSVFLKRNNTSSNFSLGSTSDNKVIFNIQDNTVVSAGVDVFAYDITIVAGWSRVSVFIKNITQGSNFRIIAEETILKESVFIFNPKITQGNQINQEAKNLILQDNTEVYSDGVIFPKISFDRKKANTSYLYANIGGISTFLNQDSLLLSVYYASISTQDLVYDNLEGFETRQKIFLKTINECKHTPTKVSFINRFGVIQDLVFFKKRTDNIDTDKESYKTNVLQQGNYYSHIGQTQTIRKESKRSVTLNSGFYPEEFNTVFEQLQNSLHYWIDDEPAVLEGSSFNVKTRVNEKLINYTFDFSYSNEEVNTI